jgi:hypothetical protein
MNKAKSQENPSAERPQYWGFISYSHQNKEWGKWVQRQLEGYRIPRRLVGRVTSQGVIPRRLLPVFRDEAELPTSSDLGNAIRSALMASRTLIVVCSPSAAKSRWVSQEVVTFKSLPGEHRSRVLCLIVDGEPNAADKPQLGAEECFPEAIRFEVDDDGRLTDHRIEPIAADVRTGASSRRDAKLKLVAGVIGVGFDELRRRDIIRGRLRFAFALAALSVVALALVASWQAVQIANRRVRALQGVRAKEMNQALREIRTEEANFPFPRISGGYSPEERDLLRRRLEAAAEAARIATSQFAEGMASGDEAEKAAGDASIVKAEVAWAEGDFALTESNLLEAISHAKKRAENVQLARSLGAAWSNDKVQAVDSDLAQAESALMRLRQFRQTERK